jgi:hypothetical protein
MGINRALSSVAAWFPPRCARRRRVSCALEHKVMLKFISSSYSRRGAFAGAVLVMLAISASASEFNAERFVAEKTSFIEDFGEFREAWFGLEEDVFGIEDIDAPIDWKKMAERSEGVVEQHQTLMRRFFAMSQEALHSVPSSQADEALAVRRTLLEFIDAAGLLVLKLLQICASLAEKVSDPYSYTMTEYNKDLDQYKNLYVEYQRLGAEVNTLFYGSEP